MSTDWKTTVEKCTVLRLNFREQGSMGLWATVMWDETGLVVIHSDHGSWLHRWNPSHLPVDTMIDFLLRIDCGYMGGKMLPSLEQREFDAEDTILSIKAAIVEQRRSGRCTAATARQEWEMAEKISCEEGWRDWVSETILTDAYEYRSTRMNSSWRNFWDRIWVPAVVPALQELKATDIHISIDVVRKPTKGA